jgi:dihydroorotase
LPAALRKVTSEPLRILGMAGGGSLRAGGPADLCVFDPEATWTVEPGALHSQGKNTPFVGVELPGRVRYTLVGGEVVFSA